MQIQEVLFTQGFGTRRVCAGLVQQGHVEYRAQNGTWVQPASAAEDVDPHGLLLRVQSVEWPYHASAYLVLHKPAGTECSQKPSTYPSVYTLLPSPLRMRPHKGGLQGVQAIGRLDQDTTGLLLLSDDGAFIHRMTSPKKHVPKVYQVQCKHAVTPMQVERLLAGVMLDGEREMVRAAACSQTAEHALELVLTEGKYHQVKRMLAAVGNRVEGLHRSQIGGYHLPTDLAPGQWRWLTADDLAQLTRVDACPA